MQTGKGQTFKKFGTAPLTRVTNSSGLPPEALQEDPKPPRRPRLLLLNGQPLASSRVLIATCARVAGLCFTTTLQYVQVPDWPIVRFLWLMHAGRFPPNGCAPATDFRTWRPGQSASTCASFVPQARHLHDAWRRDPDVRLCVCCAGADAHFFCECVLFFYVLATCCEYRQRTPQVVR